MSKTADSFEIFGDYVADELRNMHSKAPDLQRHSKREIQRIILNMNERYESRLHNNSSSQSQMSINEGLAVSRDISSQLQLSTKNKPSQFQTSCVNNPSLAPALNDTPVEDFADDEANDISLVQYYEESGSALFKM